MWSLISATWAQSVENAVVDGNRLLVYGALLVLLLALLRDERRSAWLLGALAAGVVAVALSVLVRMLGADPGSLFLLGRLNKPLGYINGEGCLFVMGFWLCWAAAERPSPRWRASGRRADAHGLSRAALSVSWYGARHGRVDRRRRCGRARVAAGASFGLLLVAVGFGLAAGPCSPSTSRVRRGALSAAATHAAARAAAEAALGVGLAWAVAVRVVQHLGRAAPIARRGSHAPGAVASPCSRWRL